MSVIKLHIKHRLYCKFLLYTGQFWNVPISFVPFTKPINFQTIKGTLYVVTVTPQDGTAPRKFLGEFNVHTWDNSAGPCLYAGNNQGGPSWEQWETPEIPDSIIRGSYSDYRVSGLFNTNFAYSKFEEENCETM